MLSKEIYDRVIDARRALSKDEVFATSSEEYGMLISIGIMKIDIGSHTGIRRESISRLGKATESMVRFAWSGIKQAPVEDRGLWVELWESCLDLSVMVKNDLALTKT